MVGRTRRTTYKATQGSVFESSEDTGLDGIGGADLNFGEDHGAFESRNDNNNGSPILDSNHSSPLGYRMDGYQITQWNGPDDEELRGEWFEDHIAVPFENLTACSNNNRTTQSSDSDNSNNSNNRKMPAMTQGTAEATDALLALFHAPLDESPPKAAGMDVAVAASSTAKNSTMVVGFGKDSNDRHSPSWEEMTQALDQTTHPPTPLLQDGANKNSNASPPDAPPDIDLAKVIYDSLTKDGIEGLSKEEKDFVTKVKRGGNTTYYINQCKARVKRFFDTIEEFGGNQLKKLLKKVPSNYSCGTKEDYAFYNILGGEKNDIKKYILNQCLVLCCMKWVILKGAKKGKPYQPSTFDKMMQSIGYDWLAKGIKFNYKEDFNDQGEFHGVVKDFWKRHQKKDPTFGTCPNRARAPEDILHIVCQAIREGKL